MPGKAPPLGKGEAVQASAGKMRPRVFAKEERYLGTSSSLLDFRSET